MTFIFLWGPMLHKEHLKGFFVPSSLENALGLYRSPPLSSGDTLQDPQWMLEIGDSTEPYIQFMPIRLYL